MNILDTPLTLFRSATDTTPVEHITLGRACEFIRGGKYAEGVRHIRGIADKKRRNAAKKRHPAVTFSGTFTKRENAALQQHSALICYDDDDVADPAALRAERAKCPYVVASFVSVSGNGVKTVVLVSPPPRDNQQQHQAWKAGADRLRLSTFDESVKDLSRLCFISHDPDIYVNPNAVPLQVEYTAPAPRRPAARPPAAGTGRAADDLVAWAIERARHVDDNGGKYGRNPAGFDLACQLRDNGLTEGEALEAGRAYVDTVALDDPNDEYTFDEYEHSVTEAFKREPREPWSPKKMPEAFTFDDLRQRVEAAEKNQLEDVVIELVDVAAGLSEADLSKAKILLRKYLPAGAVRDWIKAVHASTESGEAERYTADKLAAIITEENRFAKDAGDLLYRYAGGAYRNDGAAFVGMQVKTILEERGASDQWASRLQEEVTKYILVDAPRLWEKPPRGVLNVLNGILDVRKRTLRPHTPDFLSPVQLPITYAPDATCPAIDEWVSGTMEADCFHVLPELLAFCSMPDNPADQAVMFRGPGGNGKSIALGILQTALGSSNTAAVSLQKLTSSRFAANRLVGKVANICPDLPSSHLAETDIFKRITGGDPVNTEYKHGKDFDFMPHCKLLFSANETPTSSDTSDAYFRRWVIVPFNRKFEGTARVKRDVLMRRLTAPGELSGLLNRALERWDAVAERGVTLSESMREALLQFMEQSSPITAWLGENVVRDPEGLVECSVLMEHYRDFARQHRHTFPSAKEFGNKVRQFHPGVSVVLRYGAGASMSRTKHYAGLRLSEDYGEPRRDTDDTDTSSYRREEENKYGGDGELKSTGVEIEPADNGINGIRPGEIAPF